MFWGLIMEPQRRYSQKVKRAFHISMAALDESTSDQTPTQIICSYDDRNYLLCTLEKGKTTQVPLDLNYETGDKISFATNGRAHVHLTGYLLEEDFPVDQGEEEEVSELDESVELLSKKRPKRGDINNSPTKKSKTMELLEAVNSNDEDDSDDSDVNMSDLMEEEDDTFDTTAFEVEDENDDQDDEEEDDDQDDSDTTDGEEEEVESTESDDESSSLSDNELIAKTKKVIENGVGGKKAKKQKIEPQPTPTQQKETQQQKIDKKKKDKATKGDKTPVKMEKSPGKKDKTPGKVEKESAKAEKSQTKGDKTPVQKSPKQAVSSPKKILEGGVAVEDLKIGNGAVAKPGKLVTVYYEGRLKSNNKVFDSMNKGQGFSFRLARQEVIKGWDVGIAGMKVGGKRRVVCPPQMAYGAKGVPPTIPPSATLSFEVQLKNVQP